MVSKEGKALLIDFGASKQMTPGEGVTTSSGLCYTPGYAPIEQIEQNMDKFGPWTDFYALGATLYHLLTLNPLPSPTELMDEGDTVLQYPPTVSPQMRQLILRMMQTSRLRRPQSVAEIRALLSGKAPVADETVAAPAVPKSEETKLVTPPSIPKVPKPAAPAAPPKRVPPAARPEPRKPQPAPVYEEPKRSRPVWPFIAAAAVVLVLLLGVGGFFVSRMLKSDNKVAVVDSVSTIGPEAAESELEALAAVTPETATDEPAREETPAKPEQGSTPSTREEPASTRPAQEIGVFDVEGSTENAPVQSIQKNDVPQRNPADDMIFDVVEQQPTFREGDVRTWIASRVQYPPVAAENNVQGRVVVGFIIERDGSVSHVQVLRGVDPSLDKEAVRVVKSMPKWNPGKQNGSTVRVKYSVPITFRL